MSEKKYRVSGTGLHAIRLEFAKKGQRKKEGVLWFNDLEQAKAQVLKNRNDAVIELALEKSKTIELLENINKTIVIMSQPLNLDIVTDDYLMEKNKIIEDFNDRMSSGDTEGIF
jgi:hypothetical protein